ncbi:MAG: hypothetical protein ACOC0D_00525 [Spirochaeta sp.]
MFSKKTILALVFIICVVTLPVSAQETPEETNPNADTKLVSVNLLGPIFGLYTGSVEFPVSENLTVALQPEYMNPGDFVIADSVILMSYRMEDR